MQSDQRGIALYGLLVCLREADSGLREARAEGLRFCFVGATRPQRSNDSRMLTAVSRFPLADESTWAISCTNPDQKQTKKIRNSMIRSFVPLYEFPLSNPHLGP